MRNWMKIVFLSSLLSASCGIVEAKEYCFSDPRTQIPIIKCEQPEGWAGYGTAQWTSMPDNPVTWCYSLMNPDGSRFAQGSSFNSVVPTPIRNCHFFTKPSLFASNSIKQFAKDYGVKDLKLVSAKANDIPNGMNHPLVVALYQKNMANGIPVSGIKFVDFEAVYSGTKNGKPYKVIANIPIIGMETNGVTFINIVTSYSVGAPVDKFDAVRELQQKVIKTCQVNPGFQKFVADISNQRTAAWLKNQQEISDIINSTNENRQQTTEYVQGLWNDYIKDLEVVDNPNGGKIKVDFRHDHAAINSNNEVVYYDSGFDVDKFLPASEWKKIK